MARKASHGGIKGVYLRNLLNLKSQEMNGACVCSGGIQWKTKPCKQISERLLIPAPVILSEPETICCLSEGNATERVCVNVADAARDKSS